MLDDALADLPAPKVDANRAYLRGLGHPLVARAASGEGSLQEEVRDLFYFFHEPAQYVRNFFAIPRLKQEHDRRLRDLEGVLGGLDLQTAREAWAQIAFDRDMAEGRVRVPRFGLSAATRLYALCQTAIMYSDMGGPVNTALLDTEGLTDYLRRRRRSSLLTPVGLGGLSVGLAGTLLFVGPLRPTDPLLAGVLLGQTAFFLHQAMHLYPPPNYLGLYAKAQRTDAFIRRYLGPESSA